MKTDIQLQNDILDELRWDPAVNATDVGVIVQAGVVTLTGHLASFAEKYAAERAAERVSGVQAIVMEIEVRLPNNARRNDADIANAARNALTWSVEVPDSDVLIHVEKGWITISGEVSWDYQRKAAERVVRELVGVVGVTNLIRLKPHISSMDVKTKIQEALERHAQTQARNLQVILEGSRVTLRGTVDSRLERQAANAAAWAAPGVEVVVDELAVAA